MTPTTDDLRRARLLWDYLRLGVPAKPAECLLVLGGHDIGVAGRAAELYEQGMAPLIVASGGSRAVPDGVGFPTEADRGRDRGRGGHTQIRGVEFVPVAALPGLGFSQLLPAELSDHGSMINGSAI